MRRRHHPLVAAQRVVDSGLLAEAVQASSGQPSLLQGFQQSLLVHHRPPVTVDETSRGLHHVQFPDPDHTLRLGREGGVKGHKVRLFQKLFQRRNGGGSPLFDLFPGEVRIVGDDFHVKGPRTPGHRSADAPQADDAQHLARHSGSHQLLLQPLSLPQRGISTGDVTGRGQQQGHGVFRHSHHRRGRGVHHHDTPFSGFLHVNVVHAHSGPADDPQPLPGLNDLGRHFGGAAHHDGLVLTDGLHQLLRGEVCFDFHLGILAQHLQPFLGQGVGDQYFCSHKFLLTRSLTFIGSGVERKS